MQRLLALAKRLTRRRTRYGIALDTKSIQPSLQAGLREIANDAASDAGVTVPKAASIRDVFERTADAIQAKSKGIYQELDQASGGQFSASMTHSGSEFSAIRQSVGVEDDSVESALLERKAAIEQAQDAAFEEMRAKGVDPAKIDEARATYRKAQAIYDLDNAVKKSSLGMRPDIGDPVQAAKNAELVDPKRLFQRVNGLYDSGRLEDALGKQGADDLLEHANVNVVKHTKILRNVSRAKTAAGYAGKAALLGGGLEVGRKVLFPAQEVKDDD